MDTKKKKMGDRPKSGNAKTNNKSSKGFQAMGTLSKYIYSIFYYKFGKHYDLLFDYVDDFKDIDKIKLINNTTDFYLDLMNNKFNVV